MLRGHTFNRFSRFQRTTGQPECLVRPHYTLVLAEILASAYEYTYMSFRTFQEGLRLATVSFRDPASQSDLITRTQQPKQSQPNRHSHPSPHLCPLYQHSKRRSLSTSLRLNHIPTSSLLISCRLTNENLSERDGDLS
jgi:hypothetical protein